MNTHVWKNSIAVVAGMLSVIILSVGTDTILEKSGFFPSATEGLFDQKLLLIALAYRTIYAYVGGFVTGKLTPGRSQRPLLWLLIIGTLMGIMGVIGGWNLSQHWYPIALVFTSAAAVWYGGKRGLQKKT